MTAVAGVLAEADADAGLRDVLARVLEANERWEQLAAELRAENAQLREENARLRQEPARSHEPGRSQAPPRRRIRVVPIPPVLVRMLCHHLGDHGTTPDGRLFRGARGGMLSASVYGRVWHAARRAALGRTWPPPRSPAAPTTCGTPPCRCG